MRSPIRFCRLVLAALKRDNPVPTLRRGVATLEANRATLRRLSKVLLVLLSLTVATYCLIAVRTARASQPFSGNLTGLQETPPNASAGTGFGTVVLSDAQTMITVNLSFSGLTANATAAHIHTAPVGVAGGITFPLTGVQIGRASCRERV